MNKKYIILGVVLLVIVVLLGVLLPVIFVKDKLIITNYEECVAAGNPILESYPEKCIAEDGGIFTKQIDSLEQFQGCQIDDDCIPLPSDCHPTSCINKEYESEFIKPEVCTLIYMYEAAYSPEDCTCENKVCVNKNLDRNSLEE